MNKSILFLASALALVNAFGQPTTTPSFPPPQVQQPQDFACPAGDDQVVFSSSKFASVNDFCWTEGRLDRKDVLFGGAPGVQNILPAGDKLFAQSASKMYVWQHYFGGGWYLFSSRISGGAIAHDPNPDENSVLLTFPWDGDAAKAYVFQGGHFEDSIDAPSGVLASCLSRVRASGIEFCLDPTRSQIWVPGVTLFGYTDWTRPTALFQGQQPVNIATDGVNLYVLLGNQYDATTLPSGQTQITVKFGKLVVLRMRDNFSVQTVVDGLDVQTDPTQSRLVVSPKSIYYISVLHRGSLAQPVIWAYGIKSQTVRPVVLGDSDDYFSGLAVVPPLQAQVATGGTTTSSPAP